MSPFAAATLVFSTSAIVLVLEVLAGRLLAPYVGVTLETFTGIIGTVLAGISLGAWAGGRAADRVDPRHLLGPLLVAGGVLTFLTVPIVDFLGAGVGSGQPDAIVLLAFSGFFAPAAVLSAVSPTVVKLVLTDLTQTGAVVGRLSAIGTAGAIFGTFATGFVLIRAVPTRPTFRIVAMVLVVGGLVLWAWLRRAADGAGAADEGHRSGPVIGVGVIVAIGLAALLSLASRGPCQFESPYFCARVVADPEHPSGRVLVLDTLRHSYVDLDDPIHLEFTYAQTMSDVLATVAPAGQAIDVLHVGGGGMSLPRYLRADRPGSTSTVLELDRLLVDIARDELGFVPGDDIVVRTGDARLTLAAEPEGAYDLVIGDAFGGVSVPWHLTTREFGAQIRARLRPGGVYALNMIDYGNLDFGRAHAATLADVFAHVAVLAPPQRLRAEVGGNLILVASDSPLDVAAMLARNAARDDDEAAVTTEGPFRPGGGPGQASLPNWADWLGGAQILTDDHAPVDQLITTRG